MSKRTQSVIPADFDLYFKRTFGFLAFAANWHFIDQMRRLLLASDPMLVLDEMGL